MIQPLIWYWSQVKIDSEDLPIAFSERVGTASRFTTWAQIALDFCYSTGTRISKRGEEDKQNNLGTLAKFFSAATCNLLKRAKIKLAMKQEAYCMGPLGFTPTAAVEERVTMLKPEAVNGALYSIALLRAEDKIPKSWKFEFLFSDSVAPVWGGDIKIKVDTSCLERQRVRPTLKTMKRLMGGFTEQQENDLQKLPKWLRRREETRIIHNIEAKAQFYCEIPNFKSMKQTTVVCPLCGEEIHMDAGTRGISWQRARRRCPAKEDK